MTSNNSNKKNNSFPKSFFYGLVFFLLLVIAFSLTSFVLVVTQQFKLDSFDQKVEDNNFWRIKEKIRQYYFGKGSELYQTSKNFASFQKNGKNRIFAAENNNRVETELSFLSPNHIYNKINQKIGLDDNSSRILELVRLLHGVKILLSTDANNLNGNADFNSIFIESRNGTIKVHLVKSSYDPSITTAANTAKIKTLTALSVTKEKLKNNKEKGIAANFVPGSSFEVYLIKRNAALGAKPLETFDLALLIHKETLQIKLVARIWKKETKPRLQIKKRADSFFANTDTGVSWKIYYQEKFF